MTSKINDLTDLIISLHVICFILIKFDHPSNPRPCLTSGHYWVICDIFMNYFGDGLAGFERDLKEDVQLILLS